jgi:hypothetical protein
MNCDRSFARDKRIHAALAEHVELTLAAQAAGVPAEQASKIALEAIRPTPKILKYAQGLGVAQVELEVGGRRYKAAIEISSTPSYGLFHSLHQANGRGAWLSVRSGDRRQAIERRILELTESHQRSAK